MMERMERKQKRVCDRVVDILPTVLAGKVADYVEDIETRLKFERVLDDFMDHFHVILCGRTTAKRVYIKQCPNPNCQGFAVRRYWPLAFAYYGMGLMYYIRRCEKDCRSQYMGNVTESTLLWPATYLYYYTEYETMDSITRLY